MSLDVVIPFRPGAKDSRELKFALRSVEMYMEGLGDGECFLLGQEPPRWYTGGFVELVEYPKLSQISRVTQKLQDFVEHYAETEFVLMMDDVYLLKTWSGERFWNQHKNMASPYHTTTVSRAKFTLEQRGHKFEHDYELHVPMKINTVNLRLLLDGLNISIPIALRTLYANTFPEPSIGINDCKVMGFMKPDMKMRFLSSDDSWSASPDFYKWAGERFPKPSRWEKP